MEIQDIAAIAEIVGVTTILITFIFLGFQVKESARATRAQVMQGISEAEIAVVSQMLLHADIWEKIITDTPIDDAIQVRRAIMLFNLYMLETENRYEQHKLGYTDEKNWLSREKATRHIVTLGCYQMWLDSPGSKSRSVEFHDYLKSLRV
jgi:hypothetical protein